METKVQRYKVELERIIPPQYHLTELPTPLSLIAEYPNLLLDRLIQSRIWLEAYDRSHSAGLEEVENTAVSLCEFVSGLPLERKYKADLALVMLDSKTPICVIASENVKHIKVGVTLTDDHQDFLDISIQF